MTDASPALEAALRAATDTLAAELGCAPGDLHDAGVRVVKRPDARARLPLRRRFPPLETAVAVVSFGTGAVISASAAQLEDVRAIFAGASRDEVFEVERLAAVGALLEPHGTRCFGPAPRFVCGADTLVTRKAPPGVQIEVEAEPTSAPLAAEDWPNVISRHPSRDRPREALARALDGDTLVGLAGLSRDSELLWQIGIDVAEDARRRGVGSALTATLAAHALERGCAPYYGTAPGNVPSQRTALAAGFRPAWVEVFPYPASRG